MYLPTTATPQRRLQGDVFGQVASMPTAWRALKETVRIRHR
jgi:hypothetical protein